MRPEDRTTLWWIGTLLGIVSFALVAHLGGIWWAIGISVLDTAAAVCYRLART